MVQQHLHPPAFRSCRWYKLKHIRLSLNNASPFTYRLFPVWPQRGRNPLRSTKEQYFLNMKIIASQATTYHSILKLLNIFSSYKLMAISIYTNTKCNKNSSLYAARKGSFECVHISVLNKLLISGPPGDLICTIHIQDIMLIKLWCSRPTPQI